MKTFKKILNFVKDNLDVVILSIVFVLVFALTGIALTAHNAPIIINVLFLVICPVVCLFPLILEIYNELTDNND